MATRPRKFPIDWGASGLGSGGSATLGFTATGDDGTAYQARSTAIVVEVGASGCYLATVAAWDDAWAGGVLRFDVGSTGVGDVALDRFERAVNIGSGSNLGPGADSVTLTFSTSVGVAVADADVWVTSDAAGTSVVAGTLQTDSNGHATFLLDAGNVYYFWAQKDGQNSIRGQQFTAVAD